MFNSVFEFIANINLIQAVIFAIATLFSLFVVTWAMTFLALSSFEFTFLILFPLIFIIIIPMIALMLVLRPQKIMKSQ